MAEGGVEMTCHHIMQLALIKCKKMTDERLRREEVYDVERRPAGSWCVGCW